ncbi:MAG: hypothetical protein M3P08_05425 [Thermoproteota archaeon]|nr:hypothetical protein [Thermoproteota archaeon]
MSADNKKMLSSGLALSKIPTLLIVSLIIAGILSAVVFLINHPIRYMFYIFAVFLVGLVSLIAFKYDNAHKYELSSSALLLPLVSSSIAPKDLVDYFFIISSAVLILSNLFSNPIPYPISFIFSVIVAFFLPGWVFLRLLYFDKIGRAELGLVVLSFSISIALSAIIFLFALSLINPNPAAPAATTRTMPIVLSVVYVGISLLPLLKDHILRVIQQRRLDNQQRRYKNNNNLKSTEDLGRSHSSNQQHDRHSYNLYDILLLIWVSVFFIFFISNVYPQMAYVPEQDIARLFVYSKGLIVAPGSFSSSYPWFQFDWASVMELSSPSLWLFQSGFAYLGLFQSGFAYLSIMLIFSFYIMAKAYLNGIDKRAPLIATIFFFVFSGIAWSDDSGDNVRQYWHIFHISNKPVSGILGLGQTPFLWAWFRPLTLGFTIFFVLLYLMQRGSEEQGLVMNRNRYIIISSLMVLTLSQVYFPNLVVFVAFLLVIAIFFPKIKLRIKETAISTIIGVSVSALLQFQKYQANSSYPNEYYLALAVLAGVAFFLSKYSSRPKISFKTDFRLVLPIALYIYFAFFTFFWFTNSDVFRNRIDAVPVELYPILLGVMGIIGIPGFVVVARKYRSHPVLIFSILFLFIIVFGRALTYYNANFVNTSYWERRLIPYLFVSSSIVGSISVLMFIDYLKQKRFHFERLNRAATTTTILGVAILSFLVLGGIISTLLGLEFILFNTSQNALTDKEIKLESSLHNVDPGSTLLTYTGRSKSIADFAPLGQTGRVIPDYRYAAWSSKDPELPLNVLYTHNGSSIIYLNENDIKRISSHREQIYKGYLASHIVKVAPLLNKTTGSTGGEVLQMPTFSPPSTHSAVVLVVPNFPSRSAGASPYYYYYAYDILSLGGYNYTTALLSDINSISKAKIVIAPSEQIALKLIQYKNLYNLQFDKLIVLNVDGHNQLIDINIATTKLNPITAVGGNETNNYTRWTPSAHVGAGAIGIPKISYYNTSTRNNNTSSPFGNPENLLTAISVGPGKYKQWDVSQSLNNNKFLDLTKFDFLKFDWYGKGNGKWYVIQLWSGPLNSFWYRFQDTRYGWTEVILPMQAADGRHSLGGVTFDKLTRLGASWSYITAVNFRTYITNINQGGEFYLYKFGFGNISHSHSASVTGQHHQIQFPTYIDLYPLIIPPNSNYNTIAYYDAGVPFILQKKYNNYDMFYFNVNPIIQGMSSTMDSNNTNTRYFYPLLGKLLSWIVDAKLLSPSTATFYDFMKAGKIDFDLGQVTSFQSATFTGYLAVKSSSGILPIYVPSPSPLVPLRPTSTTPTTSTTIHINADGKDFTLKGVSQIIPMNIDRIIASSSEGGALTSRGSQTGSGFYANVLLNHPSIHFSGRSPAVILITFNNGSTSTLSAKDIAISGLARSSMYLRQPTIASDGIINFANFSGYGQIFISPSLVSGQGLKVNGKVSFDADYSNNGYIITNNTSLEGKVGVVVPNQTSLRTYDKSWILNDFSISHILIYISIIAAVVVFSKLCAMRSGKTVTGTIGRPFK